MSEWEVANNVDFRWYAFAHRVLDPLVLLGLLEERVVTGEEPSNDSVQYRIAPLFDQFLRFEFRQ